VIGDCRGRLAASTLPVGVGGSKSEIRSTKYQTNPKFEGPKSKTHGPAVICWDVAELPVPAATVLRAAGLFWSFEFADFGFVWDL
jgi:hypothetical protein